MTCLNPRANSCNLLRLAAVAISCTSLSFHVGPLGWGQDDRRHEEHEEQRPERGAPNDHVGRRVGVARNQLGDGCRGHGHAQELAQRAPSEFLTWFDFEQLPRRHRRPDDVHVLFVSGHKIILVFVGGRHDASSERGQHVVLAVNDVPVHGLLSAGLQRPVPFHVVGMACQDHLGIGVFLDEPLNVEGGRGTHDGIVALIY
mmetsp:Transcript_10009/g.26577  ORF Transcript_10009/g.26577 Transcript_10009/m.26577 type:complete len:201 (+) Transcript_10009:86-688(+)